MSRATTWRGALDGAGVRLQGAGSRRPLLLVVLGVFLYSTGPVMVSASSVSGPVFALWRLWFGVGVFALLTATHVALGGRLPRGRALRYTGFAGLAFGLHQLFFVTAIKATSVVDVLLVDALSPIVTGLVAVPMFGERPGLPFRVWSLVAIVGSALVILAGSSGPEGDPVGMLLAFLNVFAFTGFFLLSKRGREHIDVVPFLLGVMLVAAVSVSGFVTATGAVASGIRGDDLVLAAATAVVPGTLGHFVMTWPLRWIPANIPPVLRLALPVLSGVLAWLALGEAVEVGHLVGGLLTLAGVAGALLSVSGRRLLERQAAGAAEST